MTSGCSPPRSTAKLSRKGSDATRKARAVTARRRRASPSTRSRREGRDPGVVFASIHRSRGLGCSTSSRESSKARGRRCRVRTLPGSRASARARGSRAEANPRSGRRRRRRRRAPPARAPRARPRVRVRSRGRPRARRLAWISRWFCPRPRAGSRRAGCAARAASGPPVESPASTFSSSAFAASSCARARASSISFTLTASSTSASARSSSTLKKPGPVANSRISFGLRWIRVDPAFSVATSGAWRARTPISPAAPGTMTISASPSNAAPSGVTSETSNFGMRLGHGSTRRRLRPSAPSRPRPRSCRPCRRPTREGRRARRR